jgi:hypothetical protein
MNVIDFIKFVAKNNNTNIKGLGVKIGRGESSSFWRTVKTGKIQAEELKKVIESTGEPFIIVYKGQKYNIS